MVGGIEVEDRFLDVGGELGEVDLPRGHSKSSDECAAVELVDTALCHREH